MYRKPRHTYSRFARILKRSLALRLAPTVEDYDLERARLGLSCRHTNRASAAATAPPVTRKVGSQCPQR